MAATIRSLNAVRTSLANARDICTEPKIISALTDAIDELDAALLDLVQQEGKILDATNTLLEHVEPPKETKPLLPLLSLDPFDIMSEITELFLPAHQMSVWS